MKYSQRPGIIFKRFKLISTNAYVFSKKNDIYNAMGLRTEVGREKKRVNFINIYMQLLCVQIPKAQKDTDNLTEFLRFWDLRM